MPLGGESMDPARRAKISAGLKKKWADPAWRAKLMSKHTDPAQREKRAALLTARWADPAVRKKLIEAMNARKRRRQDAGVIPE